MDYYTTYIISLKVIVAKSLLNFIHLSISQLNKEVTRNIILQSLRIDIHNFTYASALK